MVFPHQVFFKTLSHYLSQKSDNKRVSVFAVPFFKLTIWFAHTILSEKTRNDAIIVFFRFIIIVSIFFFYLSEHSYYKRFFFSLAFFFLILQKYKKQLGGEQYTKNTHTHTHTCKFSMYNNSKLCGGRVGDIIITSSRVHEGVAEWGGNFSVWIEGGYCI